MKKLTQRGFTPLEGLLLVVGLTIVIVTAIYVNHAVNNSNDNLNAANKASQSAAKPSAKKVSSLAIKEWDVKIGLSADSVGAHYTVDDIQPKNPPEIIAVLLPKAEAIKGPTGVTCKDESVGLVTRLPKDDARWKDPLWSGYVTKKTIGDYSYSLSTAKQVIRKCFGTVGFDGKYKDPSAKDKFQKYINAFTQDFNSLQASK